MVDETVKVLVDLVREKTSRCDELEQRCAELAAIVDEVRSVGARGEIEELADLLDAENAELRAAAKVDKEAREAAEAVAGALRQEMDLLQAEIDRRFDDEERFEDEGRFEDEELSPCDVVRVHPVETVALDPLPPPPPLKLLSSIPVASARLDRPRPDTHNDDCRVSGELPFPAYDSRRYRCRSSEA